MDLSDVRRTTIIALFSDDTLSDLLVLKGGNALALVYGLGNRTSLDVDLSIDGDFPDPSDARNRIFRALGAQFRKLGYLVFDEQFDAKPSVPGNNLKWGGYLVGFKIIEQSVFEQLGGEIEKVRRNALVTGPLQKRIFHIELSKHEFCEGKTEAEIDDYTVYVYTPEMLAIEKLRALCQQMPEYTVRTNKTARARDFYDIHVLVAKAGVKFSKPENLGLIKSIFDAKDVPLTLISKIPETRAFHELDWPAVQNAVIGDLKPFDYYFDFVVEQTKLLESLWKE